MSFTLKQICCQRIINDPASFPIQGTETFSFIERDIIIPTMGMSVEEGREKRRKEEERRHLHDSLAQLYDRMVTSVRQPGPVPGQQRSYMDTDLREIYHVTNHILERYRIDPAIMDSLYGGPESNPYRVAYRTAYNKNSDNTQFMLQYIYGDLWYYNH